MSGVLKVREVITQVALTYLLEMSHEGVKCASDELRAAAAGHKH